MSASLVGSEMCIRDSVGKRDKYVASLASLPHRPVIRFLLSQAALSTPVSYTHLTLPTICSV
eukprot:6303116-Alexandrium_andersonii.AAC.1